jgi:hypothetical protein
MPWFNATPSVSIMRYLHMCMHACMLTVTFHKRGGKYWMRCICLLHDYWHLPAWCRYLLSTLSEMEEYSVFRERLKKKKVKVPSVSRVLVLTTSFTSHS